MIKYRTRDGSADYSFTFERASDAGNITIYIDDMPSYGWRNTRNTVTHRLGEGSRRCICWTGRLDTEEEAKDVAALWADMTQTYIGTGETIDAQVTRMQAAGQWPPPRMWDRYEDDAEPVVRESDEEKSWFSRLFG